MKTLFFVSCLLLALPGLLKAQDKMPQLIKTFHPYGNDGWDYLALNPDGKKLYISHGTRVNIVNAVTGDSISVIENTTGVHGIAFVPALHKGFTSNGRLNNLTVFNMETDKATGQIATGENPDAIMYEPFSRTIISCNGKSNNLSIIDPVLEKEIKTIAVGGKPETAVSDNAGRLFVNVEDKNEIVVVDLKTYQVIAHWALAPGTSPTGLAIDTKAKRLFAGCDKLLMVLNMLNGAVIAKLPIGNGCDGVAFDGSTKTIYTSNGEGTMTIIKERSPQQFKVIASVPTKGGARTITLNENTHTIFLPTAEYEAAVQTQGAARQRPAIKSGTFQVLVFK